ncbi:ImmA/IrrE family metallo-endopeptidase [Methylomagnum ishizawai]|uniref:ImmA/IrrE family metallo-endopeptidase n=1 Tax=Methylomagnum ishizawai TaxID=1760988 RepID=UPI001C328594|nr:ImmA/IrrE family metallo-endopeptidase [Methylomagnum ishizawai]BBL77501.1 hypothetical protein MishRS11D_45990 [Methylomagnum ishizawai]
MAKNLLLTAKTAQDINNRIDRVLRGLGNPEPPLRLEDVRELLKLDRAFYKADDPSVIQETISRIRIATIQVYQRPTLLIEAIQKFSLKALYIPDRKRILLDASLPEKKHRWNEAHEIGHSLIPWHDEMMLGDNIITLSHNCHEHIEAEANYAAGQLLFLRDRFLMEACSVEPTINSINRLHNIFGNTISTTLYRFIETVGVELPIVGLITDHPHIMRRPETFDYDKPCRHFIQSPAFAKRFSKLSETELFDSVSGYCGSQRGGSLGKAELILDDDNGSQHRFIFETFFNTYDALTLGVYCHPESRIIAIAG